MEVEQTAAAATEPAAGTGAAAAPADPPATDPPATETAATQDQGTPPAVEAKAAAPIAYDFKTPDGVEISAATMDAFTGVAKELNLPADSAQKIIDAVAPAMAARQTEMLRETATEWANSAKGDKEYGGDAFDANLSTAKKALDTFATKELKEMLESSGLGSHPEVIRMFYRVGMAISEDRFVSGQGGDSKTGTAQRLYAASNMNP
ncbi:MAG: hypothetical protein KA435_09860 [Azonexus sp.]|nr:hypothetical protein [Azonexus sp.]